MFSLIPDPSPEGRREAVPSPFGRGRSSTSHGQMYETLSFRERVR
jgi:hypothetical protein